MVRLQSGKTIVLARSTNKHLFVIRDMCVTYYLKIHLLRRSLFHSIDSLKKILYVNTIHFGHKLLIIFFQLKNKINWMPATPSFCFDCVLMLIIRKPITKLNLTELEVDVDL